MNFDLQKCIRQSIWNLTPYSSARDEFKGEASVFIDANENPFDTDYNRYPDPYQLKVKKKISALKNIPVENIFVGGAGSDEAIDLIYRMTCDPKLHNVILTPPTYGMYKVSANVNDVEIRSALLKKIEINNTRNFALDFNAIKISCDENTRLIFICSPNNPTSGSFEPQYIRLVLEFALERNIIVVIDEAYIDFSEHHSWLNQLLNFPNLIILQTLSKAWGHAAIRLGMCFASESIIKILNKVKLPYNVSLLVQEYAVSLLDKEKTKKKHVNKILKNREKLILKLKELDMVKYIYPTDSNFLLVEFENPDGLYAYLIQNQIVVRNRSKEPLCKGCLRITVGKKSENKKLVKILKEYSVIKQD